MATIKPFTLLDWLLVLLILTIGGGARAGYLIVYCANGQSSGPVRAQTDKFSTNTGTSLSPGYGWFRQLDAEAPRLGVAAESLPRFIQAALEPCRGYFISFSHGLRFRAAWWGCSRELPTPSIL